VYYFSFQIVKYGNFEDIKWVIKMHWNTTSTERAFYCTAEMLLYINGKFTMGKFK
jgi:hypothetical protein